MIITNNISIQNKPVTIQTKSTSFLKKQNNGDIFCFTSNNKLKSPNNSTQTSFGMNVKVPEEFLTHNSVGINDIRKIQSNGLFATTANTITDKQEMIINSIIGKCYYGKDAKRLLHPVVGLNINTFDNGLLVENYENLLRPDFSSLKGNSKKIYGTCLELVYKTSNELEDKLGDDINFKWVSGQCNNYFSVGYHQYFLAWPKKLDSVINKKLQLNPTKIPPRSVIIDPSFNKVIHAEQKPEYTLEIISDLDELNNTHHKYGNFLEFDGHIGDDFYTGALPLGFVKDFATFKNSSLINEMISKETLDNSMVYFTFKKSMNKPQAKPDVALALQPNPNDKAYTYFSDAIKKSITPNCFLSKFLKRVDEQLKQN